MKTMWQARFGAAVRMFEDEKKANAWVSWMSALSPRKFSSEIKPILCPNKED